MKDHGKSLTILTERLLKLFPDNKYLEDIQDSLRFIELPEQRQERTLQILATIHDTVEADDEKRKEFFDVWHEYWKPEVSND